MQGDTLPTQPESPSVAASKPVEQELSVPAIRGILTPAVKAKATDDGWAHLGAVGQHVVNQNPSFDARNYGFAKLGLLVRQQSYLDVKDVPLGNGLNQIWVRLRNGGKPAKKAAKKS